MAWSTNDIYKFLLYQTRKNQSSSLSATDLFYAWNSEQSGYQSDLLGRFQKLANSKEGINTGLIENETIMTKLAVFTQTTSIPVVVGQAPKPSDFVYALALRINGAKVFKINQDEIWAMNEDIIDPPSIAANSYYYAEYQLYYSIFPAAATPLQLDYIQQVTDIVWGFTFDGNNRQVYNPATSVQPLWGQNSIVEITKRTLDSLGISYKDQDFEQAGKSTQLTGE
jgi:hypothetical protein